jgi:hypothetical protein
MNINTDAIDEVSLALLYLTLHDRYRAWKGFDWDVLNRLYERGFIEDPVSKTLRHSGKNGKLISTTSNSRN